MLTTFDKYLLKKLIYTFVVFLVATYGLYIVIDLFTNMDDFQKAGDLAEETRTGSGSATVVMAIRMRQRRQTARKSRIRGLSAGPSSI